ncbi:MAG: hypothetical protein ACR2JB_02280 [Bryobacteraceae bacterium]
MQPPLFCYAPTEFRDTKKILFRKQAVETNSLPMPMLTLSTGVRLLSEHVLRAEYYPCGSVRSDGLIDFLLSRNNAALARQEQDLLYVRTIDGAARVRGSGAAQDATALEEAGVPVYRSP